MVELNEGTPQKEIQKLVNTLEENPYIKSETIEFIDKETIAEEMKEELGTTENTLGISNPFYDMVNFNLQAEYLDSDTLESMRNQIMQNENVKDVFYQDLLVDQVNDNIRKIGLVALLLGLFFIGVAMLLIHNTIRLAMYSNRFIIKNMQLVGATWDFISKPYLSKGLINGLWSGAIAIVLLVFVIFLIHLQFPALRFDIWLDDIFSMFVVMSGLVLIGILITYGSTYFVVNKYLKMRLDDLY
jgi:cell division transport system permease protein